MGFLLLVNMVHILSASQGQGQVTQVTDLDFDLCLK